MSDRNADKIIIGLTGNIATGKSVVRRMLEHLGAFGIDADGLSHRAMSPGAPAYKPVAELFGKWVVKENGEINRQRLGTIAFSDPEAMEALESIVHPFVRQAIELLIKRAKQRIVVVEAIKLYEGGLADKCDQVWVVDAPDEVRLARLMRHRGMSEAEATVRMEAQSPQSEKLARADVIINNGGNYEVAYDQVQQQLQKLLGGEEAVAEPEEKQVVQAKPGEMEITVRRASPKDAKAIAEFVNRTRGKSMDRSDVIMSFGQQAYVLAFGDDKLVGLGGFQVENLIARISEFTVDPTSPVPDVAKSLLAMIEQLANSLQGEIALLFLPKDAPDGVKKICDIAGYEPQEIGDLKVPDWRDAAKESQPDDIDAQMFMKKLREGRVLTPI